MTVPEHNEVGTVGGTLGARVAKLVADAAIYGKAKASPHMSRVAVQAATDFTNHVSDEVRGVMGDLFRKAARDPETPDFARPLLKALGEGRGQAWAWIGGTATGAALGGGLMNLLTNAMNPVVLPLIAAHPAGILSPTDAAQGEARGVAYSRSWQREAAYSGIDSERFQALVRMHQQSLNPSDIHTLVNRGQMAVSTATTLLRSQGYRPDVVDELVSLRTADITPADAAAMWNRGIVSTEVGQAIARRWGVSAQDFNRLTELGGEPPATDELLQAWRKGVVTEAQVDRALRQGPLRFEWIPTIKALQWQTLPLGEVADAVNQGHMTPEQGARIARLHGLKEPDFAIVIKNAGIPPGPQEILDWVNRGLITEAQGKQALYESRIKNAWVPKYLESRHETMPPETVRLMFTRGAITKADALRRLQMRGYSPADAAILIDGASAEKTQTQRDLTVSQIRDLYSERALGRNEAHDFITALGYEDDEAEWILLLADLKRQQKFVNAAMSRIRTNYLAGRVDEATASALLDALQVPADQRDDALAIWAIERETTSQGLTPSQIQQAYKKGFIDFSEAMARLLGRGYPESDAQILLALAVPPPQEE